MGVRRSYEHQPVLRGAVRCGQAGLLSCHAQRPCSEKARDRQCSASRGNVGDAAITDQTCKLLLGKNASRRHVTTWSQFSPSSAYADCVDRERSRATVQQYLKAGKDTVAVFVSAV